MLPCRRQELLHQFSCGFHSSLIFKQLYLSYVDCLLDIGIISPIRRKQIWISLWPKKRSQSAGNGQFKVPTTNLSYRLLLVNFYDIFTMILFCHCRLHTQCGFQRGEYGITRQPIVGSVGGSGSRSSLWCSSRYRLLADTSCGFGDAKLHKGSRICAVSILEVHYNRVIQGSTKKLSDIDYSNDEIYTNEKKKKNLREIAVYLGVILKIFLTLHVTGIDVLILSSTASLHDWKRMSIDCLMENLETFFFLVTCQFWPITKFREVIKGR